MTEGGMVLFFTISSHSLRPTRFIIGTSQLLCLHPSLAVVVPDTLNTFFSPPFLGFFFHSFIHATPTFDSFQLKPLILAVTRTQANTPYSHVTLPGRSSASISSRTDAATKRTLAGATPPSRDAGPAGPGTAAGGLRP